MDEFQARRLVEAYADMILRISYQYLQQTQDAEDICQTVFLKYLTANCTYDSIEHERAWIIRTTINTCKDLLKSAHRRKTIPLENLPCLAAPVPEDTGLWEAMQCLPEQYRIILHLFYFEGYSAREIGAVTGKSEANVTMHLSRARRKLKRILTEEGRQIV